MTTYSVSNLLNPPTADAVLASMLSALTTAGFQATTWQEGSVQRTLLERFAASHAEQLALVSTITKGGYLTEAPSSWLSLLAESLYGQTRRAATTAVYNVTLTNSSGSAHSISAGALWFATSSGKRYNNITGGTLGANSTLTISVQGESPGARYNTGAHSIIIMLTPLVGVTCTNASGTPTTVGNNEQSDVSLIASCVGKWATLGQGSTDAAYAYWAKNVSANVSKIKVLSGSIEGGLRLILSGDSAGVDQTTIDNVQAAIDVKTQTGITVSVESATTQAVPITADVYVSAGYTTGFDTIASAALDAYFDDLGIGETAYYSDILTVISSLEGVEHVEPSTFVPSDDVVPSAASNLLIRDENNTTITVYTA